MASRPSPDMEGLQNLVRQWREHSQEQRRNTLQLDADNQQLSAENRQLTSDNVELQQVNQQLETKIGALQGAIDRLQQDVLRLVDEIQTERNARHEQEQHTNFYRERHDAVHNRLTNLLAENARADRHAKEAGISEARISQNTSHATRARERSHFREHREQDHPPRSSQPRDYHQSHQGPPVTYETQTRGRPRHSSSTRRSNRSSSSTAVETSGIPSRRERSPKGPSIPIQTKPFRTGF
jgi:hypothetical protein